MVTASPEATTTEGREIHMKNIGPVDDFRFVVPSGGGITKFVGANGSGKSHALDAISRLAGNGSIKPPLRDNASVGLIEGCGMTITVGSKIHSNGELDVLSIEGQFDLSKLVDPGIASQASANAARIKQLLKILELPADESLFHGLAGGEKEFEALAIKPSDDVVELAGRVKRALEGKAQTHESEATRLLGQHQTRAKDLQEYGPEIERDADKLQSALEAAIAEKSAIDEQRKNADAQAWRRKEAQEKLAALPESNLAELMAECDITKSQFDAQAENIAAINQRIAALQAQLKDETTKYQTLENQLAVAGDKIVAEKQRCHEREQFEAILAAELPVGPTEAAKNLAYANLDEARAACELGVKARLADQHADEAKKLKAEEATHRKEAGRLRESARGTEAVLSELVERLGVDLKIHEGQLCIETDRGMEPYAELSHGERWKIAISLGQLRVGPGGYLIVPQEAWESLDPTNQQKLWEAACQYDVRLFVGHAADGELRVEDYNAEASRR